MPTFFVFLFREILNFHTQTYQQILVSAKNQVCYSKKANLSEENIAKTNQSDVQKYEVPFLNTPGVYEILDVQQNKSYYGETNSLVRRFMHHWQRLEDESHECKALVESFQNKKKNIEGFRFFVHKSGPVWENKELRLEYEQKLIDENKNQCYNIVSEERTFENVRKPLFYKGTVYSSACVAAKSENLACATIL